MGEHDLQPVLSDDRAVAALREKQIQQAHQALPNELRKMLRRSGWRNRISRCSPAKLATASREERPAGLSWSKTTGVPVLEAFSTDSDSGITPSRGIERISLTFSTDSISPFLTRSSE